MGKNLIQQRRGKGSIIFRAPGHNYKTRIIFPNSLKPMLGYIKDFIHDPSKTAPVAKIIFENKEHIYIPAPEGLKIGDKLNYINNNIAVGSIAKLKDIPVGTNIYSIEKIPNSSYGAFCRAAGSFGVVKAKTNNSTTILFNSKKQKEFHPDCRAVIGIVAGSGRLEKPVVKAGKKHYMMRARNRYWPNVSGVSMNAVAHPFGSGRGKHLGKPKTPPRYAPPGRKVGLLHAKRTGRKTK